MSKIIWKSDIIKENLDSICVIDNNILVTAKESDTILIFNRDTGKLIDRWTDDFDRPNGITSYKNLVGIVERDGKCFKLYDYNGRKLIYKYNKFKKPYGITNIIINGKIIFYITDDGTHKIHEFIFDLGTMKLINESVWKTVPSDCKLESLYVDLDENKMIVANESKYLIHIYEYSTKKLLNVIGQRFLNNEPEGLGKWKNYYVFTNQSKTNNCFHFVDCNDYDVKFTITFNDIINTDGICIDNNHLLAINDDKQLVCVNIEN
jgi:hypothetical protein